MISVLLPARNASNTLTAALESVFSQSIAPHQIIIIDDGSTDATPEILRDLALKYPHLKVLRTSGLGISNALNLGLEHCTGRWIARMDADDLCHPTRFERQLKRALSDPQAHLVSGMVTANETLDSRGMSRHIAWANDQKNHDELLTSLWIDSPLPHPTWFVSKEAFEHTGPYTTNTDLPEDYEWLHRYFLMGSEKGFRAAKVLGEPILTWTDSHARLTRTHPAYSQEAFAKVKTQALLRWISVQSRTFHKIYLLGMGPTGKLLLRALQAVDRSFVSTLVDVSPTRTGMNYKGLSVLSPQQWEQELDPSASLTLIALGTPEKRTLCERYCESKGLIKGKSYLSF